MGGGRAFRLGVPPALRATGYEGKSRIVLKCKGSGGLQELREKLDEDSISFCLFRFMAGDQESKRVKFMCAAGGTAHPHTPCEGCRRLSLLEVRTSTGASTLRGVLGGRLRSECSRRGRPSTRACARSFLTYIGTNVGGMAKGRSAGHRGDIAALIGQSHLQINADGDMDEFTQEEVADKIKKSSGANYDLGSNDGGGNYKSQAPLYSLWPHSLWLYSLWLYSPLSPCASQGGRDRQGGGSEVPRAREGDHHRARQVRDLCSAQGNPDRPPGAADGGA